MSAPRLAFFCRGSTDVGLGHVMRTRAVAEAAGADAEAHVFAVGDDAAHTLLESSDTDFDLYAEDESAIRAIESWSPSVCFIDTTSMDADHFDRLDRVSATASLSPVFDQLERCELFYHRTSVHPLSARESWKRGLEFAVVRDACTRIPENLYRDAIDPGAPLSVAISMGGGDADNKTLRVLERLRTLDRPMLFWVLLGEGYQHSYDELIASARADRRHEVILARTTDAMWRVMRSCSVAVLAGGTVTYEAAAAGLPSINLFDDDAHAYLIEELVGHRVAWHAGAPFNSALDRTAALLKSFHDDRTTLLAAHRASKNLIDGRGARRIIEHALSIIDTSSTHEAAA